MTYTLTTESFNSLASSWDETYRHFKGNSIFVLPYWIKVWWQQFGSGELYLPVIREENTILGFAPLVIKGETASFTGSSDICDYLDFVIAPGRERDFFTILCYELLRKGITQLNLKPVREDSIVFSRLLKIAQEAGYYTSSEHTDVSLEMDLPPTWDEYLNMLNTKQRHEVKRKLNRLYEAGEVKYHVVEDSANITDKIHVFLKIFRENKHEDKATFMTAEMESFFRPLVESMAAAKLLRMGILELNNSPVSVVLSFAYNDREYLYNSGYYPQYGNISAGLMAKVLHIKDSIERGRKIYDFLKGAEVYKYRLGGKEKAIYNCQFILK